MKFLGLMGVVLWLGTLLANAGSAERVRAGLSALDQLSAQVEVAPTLCAAKSDNADKDATDKSPPAAPAPAAAPLAPRSTPSGEILRGPGAQTLRALLVACHPGQGPPEPARA